MSDETMSKPAGPVVVVTGAGASKPLGYPTTIEFFANAEAVPQQFKDIYEGIRQKLGVKRQVVDVEDLLRILQASDEFLRTEAGKFLGPMLQKNWARLVPDFTRNVRDRCFELYGRRPDSSRVRDLYMPVLDICGWKQHAVDLFTANYDPVTDDLLEIASGLGLRAYDGFGDLARWDPERYEWSEPGLRVFRLHGSMSWVRDGDRILNTRDYNLRRNPSHRHLLIYPGFKGDPELDEMDEVFRFAHRRLRSALKSATVLLAIGFSFRDDAINRILTGALIENPQLTVVILNPQLPPGSGDVIAKLHADESGRLIPVEVAFGDDGAADRLIGSMQQLRAGV
jgi:hypothetical protein